MNLIKKIDQVKQLTQCKKDDDRDFQAELDENKLDKITQ